MQICTGTDIIKFIQEVTTNGKINKYRDRCSQIFSRFHRLSAWNSTDYHTKSYDISELGISEEDVKRLITERIDIDILNRLLEHDHFPRLCIMIRNFFDDTIAEGVMVRNQVIDFAVDQLTDLLFATAEAIKTIRDALPDKPASDITSDDVENAVAFYMGQATDLNDKGLTMVQEFAKYIFDNSVSEERSDDC